MDGHVDEMIDLYALGALEPGEQAMVDRHLEQCRACRAHLADARRVAAQLAWSAPQHEPPADLQRKVRRRVEQLQRQERPEPSVSPARSAFSWRRSLRGGLLAAGLAALLVLAGWNVTLQRQVAAQAAQLATHQQLDEMLRSPGARVITLQAQPAAPKASGSLVIAPSSTEGYLVTAGLPVLSRDRSYQLWLQEGEERTSAGVFRVDERGTGALLVRSQHALADYTGCGITIEPAGGSARPTGDRVLRSQTWSDERTGATGW